MEKDQFTQLFSDYRPPLTPKASFMQQINRELDSVAIIKQSEAAMRRRRRVALLVAFIAGVLTGVAGTLSLPYMMEFFASIRLPEVTTLPHLSVPLLPMLLSWLVIGGASILLALQGYSLVSTVMESREKDR